MRIRLDLRDPDEDDERLKWEAMALKEKTQALKEPLVVVVWEDAYSDGGWRRMREHREDGHQDIVTSVGFLVRDDEHAVRLLQSKSLNRDTGADSITIPREMVRRIDRVTAREPFHNGR